MIFIVFCIDTKKFKETKILRYISFGKNVFQCITLCNYMLLLSKNKNII